MEKIVYEIGLIRGRHEIPRIDKYIFEGEIEDPSDIPAIQHTAYENIGNIPIKYHDVKLYVTGLTPCLVEVINACRYFRFNLILMHFNPKTNDYYEQEVISYK